LIASHWNVSQASEQGFSYPQVFINVIQSVVSAENIASGYSANW